MNKYLTACMAALAITVTVGLGGCALEEPTLDDAWNTSGYEPTVSVTPVEADGLEITLQTLPSAACTPYSSGPSAAAYFGGGYYAPTLAVFSCTCMDTMSALGDVVTNAAVTRYTPSIGSTGSITNTYTIRSFNNFPTYGMTAEVEVAADGTPSCPTFPVNDGR